MMLTMAWYSDKHRLTYTHVYDDRTSATVDARKAAGYGWRVDAEEESDAAFGDRNWATGGPVGTFVAGLREQRQYVVTYVRTDEWTAANTSR
jgi:hypothetical protein